MQILITYNLIINHNLYFCILIFVFVLVLRIDFLKIFHEYINILYTYFFKNISLILNYIFNISDYLTGTRKCLYENININKNYKLI